MVITLKHEQLCCVLWSLSKNDLNRLEAIVEFIKTTYHAKVDVIGKSQIESFLKLYDVKMKSLNQRTNRLKIKHSDWMDTDIEISACKISTGAPCKTYDDLSTRSKKKRLAHKLSIISNEEVSDTFKEMLKKEKQPKSAINIAEILPTASPKRLKRIAESVPTPTSQSNFTEEEAIALMLELDLSRNKYQILRKALLEKGHSILPSYKDIQEKKQTILPSISVTEKEACVELSSLLENTATRIVADFSADQLEKVNNSDVVLICKWGCDGLSALPEYKHASGSKKMADYKSVFIASLVPLRMRSYSLKQSSSKCKNSFEDIWLNTTPGSKHFCRPIWFEYTRESKTTTKDLVEYIKDEINDLQPLSITINQYTFDISFQLSLTMIDGKVSNAITETSSFWKCSLCDETKSQFSDIGKARSINEEFLSFGISPLHARIRFMEHFLHIAYDLKYRSVPENLTKPTRNNEDLKTLRISEKSRIQDEFREETGLNIDKPLPTGGSTNDGNTARRFFGNFEATSKITGINKELLERTNILLMAINSKHKINSARFGEYATEISKLLVSLYPWKEMTPTVHKVLCHGEIIIERNILPLGELTEEAQEARNRDFKHVQLFSSRKCSRTSQNEDIFNSLLLSSDPVLSSMRKRWIYYEPLSTQNTEDLKDLYYLLDMYTDTTDYFIENK